MNPRVDEDLYAKVIEIAQEQAHSSTAMAELHRQNVAKSDTMMTLLSAQTTSLVSISAALTHMNEAVERSEKSIKEHITKDVDDRMNRVQLKFWVGVAIVAVSASSDTLARILGLFK